MSNEWAYRLFVIDRQENKLSRGILLGRVIDLGSTRVFNSNTKVFSTDEMVAIYPDIIQDKLPELDISIYDFERNGVLYRTTLGIIQREAMDGFTTMELLNEVWINIPMLYVPIKWFYEYQMYTKRFVPKEKPIYYRFNPVEVLSANGHK